MSILKTNLNCFKQNGLYRFDDSLLNIFHQSPSEKEKIMQKFNLRHGTENISGISRAALYDYTTDDAYGINFFLQTGQLRPGARYDSSFYRSFADDVYNALNEIPNTEGVFYRQIGFGGAPNSMFHRGKEDFINFAKFHQDNIGKVIEYPSFTSTSLIESSYTPKTPYRGALMIYGKNGKIKDLNLQLHASTNVTNPYTFNIRGNCSFSTSIEPDVASYQITCGESIVRGCWYYSGRIF